LTSDGTTNSANAESALSVLSNVTVMQSSIWATGSVYTTGSIYVTGSIDVKTTPGTASIMGLVSSASYTEIFEIVGSNGTYNWNKPSWAKTVTVVCIAGGGGGGGARTAFSSVNRFSTGGAGGAGGAIVMGRFDASNLSSTVLVTVGRGGNSTTTLQGQVPGAGGIGGDSTFGEYIRAQGGAGGVGSITSANTTTTTAYTVGRGSIGFMGFGSGWGGRGIVLPTTGIDGEPPALPMRDAINAPFAPASAYPWPSALTTTGGGGGAGMDCLSQPCAAYSGRGAGGRINGGGRGTAYPSYDVAGVVPNNVTYQRPTNNNVPAYYTLVGLGGRGGESGVDAEDGALYGGGGGGARPQPAQNTDGFPSGKGGNGVVVVISEA
jgi:hypothetical protein